MSIKVYGKGSVDLLCKFKSKDFSFYELHLGLLGNSPLNDIQKLPNYIKIKTIHNPTRVKINNQIHGFDLTCGGRIEKLSWEALYKTQIIGKSIGCNKIVIHGASYNPYTENKKEKLKSLVQKIKTLDIDPLFENDALWAHSYFKKHPLLCFGEDFEDLREEYGEGLKLTFDLEHLNLSYIFKRFIKKNKGAPLDLAAFNNLYKEFVDHQNLKPYLELCLKRFIKNFRKNIKHLHVNGSDFSKFTYKKKNQLPLEGEHLDILENNSNLKDKNNYKNWAKQINKYIKMDIGTVLELRPTTDYRSRMLKSKKRLIKKALLEKKS